MPFMKQISLSTLILAFSSVSVHAAIFYRHLPFNLSMSPNDKLVANYNFDKKSGVQCSSTHGNIRIDFIYKGNEKSSSLPTILLNNRLPEKKTEKLADTSGQLTIYMSQSKHENTSFIVNCDYMSPIIGGLKSIS